MLRSASVRIAKWYLSLFPVSLQPYQIDRQPLQRAYMEYDDECSSQGFRSAFFPSVTLQGKRLLDYGCGFGGRPVRYAELGAEVSGTEVVPEMVDEAEAFARRKQVAARFCVVSDRVLPFAEDSFDLVFSYDVFEHVRDLEASLRECLRVLKPGGKLCAIFPPFYHPTGGSHLHNYLSKSPAPNVFFPCSVLRTAAQELLNERQQPYPGGPLDPPDYPLWSVNGTTVRRLLTILRRIPCSSTKVEYLPMISPSRKKWREWHMKYYAWPFQLAAQIPLLNEVLTDRIRLTLTK